LDDILLLVGSLIVKLLTDNGGMAESKKPHHFRP